MNRDLIGVIEYENMGAILCGMNPVGFNLGPQGKRLSVITMLSTRGIEDIDVVHGTVNGEVFTHFVEYNVLPIHVQKSEVMQCND